MLEIRAIVLTTLFLTSTLVSANTVDMNADEFRYWRTYVQLQNAPKLKPLTENAKRAQIAKHLKISPAQLSEAIAKGEQHGEGIEQRTAEAISKALETTMLKGRIQDLTINTDTDQAVAFIKWTARSPLDFDKEACWAAWAVGEAGHIVNILVLWAVNAADATVFSAKVGRTAFTRIHKNRINSFASTRYIKMFEDVKRGPEEH